MENTVIVGQVYGGFTIMEPVWGTKRYKCKCNACGNIIELPECRIVKCKRVTCGCNRILKRKLYSKDYPHE